MAKKAAAARVETVEETPVSPIQQKLQTIIKDISDKLIERDDEVLIFATAMVCHEHGCLQGPPGTGKSLLSDAFMSALDGPTFSILMMKDLPADAIFGPLDIPRLLGKTTGESEYHRLTKGYAPSAVLVFTDEIFKAGPAVLNRFLKIMNERRFENGNQIIQVPLITVFAASNEWPNDQEGGKELAALVDRFLFRKNIKPVSTQAGRQRLLWERDHTPKLSVKLTPQELHQARTEALTLPWHPKAKDVLGRILMELSGAGIVVGDRRQYKSVDAAAAYAYVTGAKAVEPEHLEILQHVLWTDPSEQPEKAGEIVRRLANPVGAEINNFLMEAQGVMDQTTMTDLGSVIQANRKLQEIETKLVKLKETPRQKQVLEFIQSTMRDLGQAAMKNNLLK